MRMDHLKAKAILCFVGDKKLETAQTKMYCGPFELK